MPIRNNKTYRAFQWIVLLACLLVLAYISPTLLNPEHYSTDDFFPYWASGKLNLSGENPYDPQKKDALQVAVSGHGSTVYPISIMLNPPFVVSLVMPFGLLSYPLSRMVWLLLSIGCVVFSAQLFWRFYDGPSQKRWLAWTVIVLFAPIISVLEVGQISAFILLGITGFIYFSTVRQNDWAAGAFLVLVAIKPQVTYLLWIALLFWIIKGRRWIVLIGCIVTALVLTLVAVFFNPGVIQQYLYMVQTGYLTELATPTLGAYLRFLWLGTENFWLQFVAPVFGVFWFLYYWHNHHDTWSWLDELPVLLLVTILTASYTYTYDQVILVPAIIQATIWLAQDWKRWLTLLFAVAFLALNILDLILHMKLSDFWFIWMAPAFFIWFLLIRRIYSQSRSKTPQLLSA